MTERDGLFIAIEGGDGSGKGTQAEITRAYMSDVLAKNVLKLSFPRYGKASAYFVEQYLNGAYGQAEDVPADLGALPYVIDRVAASADIRQHIQKPNSAVITDRYAASNFAHQGTKIDDETARHDFYKRMMELEYDVMGIPRPSLNIVLLVPTLLAQTNVDKKASRDYTTLKRDIHEANSDHLEKAKRNYEELCELFPDEFTPIQCVNGSGEMRSIDDIQADIRKIIGVE